MNNVVWDIAIAVLSLGLAAYVVGVSLKALRDERRRADHEAMFRRLEQVTRTKERL